MATSPISAWEHRADTTIAANPAVRTDIHGDRPIRAASASCNHRHQSIRFELR
jgi:hypothetical protein